MNQIMVKVGLQWVRARLSITHSLCILEMEQRFHSSLLLQYLFILFIYFFFQKCKHYLAELLEVSFKLD